MELGHCSLVISDDAFQICYCEGILVVWELILTHFGLEWFSKSEKNEMKEFITNQFQFQFQFNFVQKVVVN